jgi:hypothetical protein
VLGSLLHTAPWVLGLVAVYVCLRVGKALAGFALLALVAFACWHFNLLGAVGL